MTQKNPSRFARHFFVSAAVLTSAVSAHAYRFGDIGWNTGGLAGSGGTDPSIAPGVTWQPSDTPGTYENDTFVIATGGCFYIKNDYTYNNLNFVLNGSGHDNGSYAGVFRLGDSGSTPHVTINSNVEIATGPINSTQAGASTIRLQTDGTTMAINGVLSGTGDFVISGITGTSVTLTGENTHTGNIFFYHNHADEKGAAINLGTGNSGGKLVGGGTFGFMATGGILNINRNAGSGTDNGNVTLAYGFTGLGTINQTGTGTTTFTGNSGNFSSGALNVSDGTAVIAGGAVFGGKITTSGAGFLLVDDGATLAFTGSSAGAIEDEPNGTAATNALLGANVAFYGTTNVRINVADTEKLTPGGTYIYNLFSGLSDTPGQVNAVAGSNIASATYLGGGQMEVTIGNAYALTGGQTLYLLTDGRAPDARMANNIINVGTGTVISDHKDVFGSSDADINKGVLALKNGACVYFSADTVTYNKFILDGAGGIDTYGAFRVGDNANVGTGSRTLTFKGDFVVIQGNPGVTRGTLLYENNNSTVRLEGSLLSDFNRAPDEVELSFIQENLDNPAADGTVRHFYVLGAANDFRGNITLRDTRPVGEQNVIGTPIGLNNFEFNIGEGGTSTGSLTDTPLTAGDTVPLFHLGDNATVKLIVNRNAGTGSDNGNITIYHDIDGGGQVIQRGTGTTTFTGRLENTGGVIVEAGTLVASGTVSAKITVTGGSVTLANSIVLEFVLDGASGVAGGAADAENAYVGGGAITIDSATLNVVLKNPDALAPGTYIYNVFTGAVVTGSITANFPVTGDISYAYSNGQVTVTVVPEPGTYALWAGMSLLGAVFLRRRRK